MPYLTTIGYAYDDCYDVSNIKRQNYQNVSAMKGKRYKNQITRTTN